MFKKKVLASVLGLGMAIGSASAMAGEFLKPFILGSAPTSNDISTVVSDAKSKLIANGFEVVGEYSPYRGTSIVVVTNNELKSTASKTEFGGYGAVTRVSITKVGNSVQVSYSNPKYMANSYRLKSNLDGVSNSLKVALGAKSAFGSAEGIEDEDLRDWHYMFGMPYFDDAKELGTASSHKDMIAQIEGYLGAKKGGLTKVFSVKIPGKDTVLYGIGIGKGDGSDEVIMSSIDNGELRHTSHLPYGLLVVGNSAYMLDGKFRIASSFPDLSMGQFMSIQSAPDKIYEAFATATGVDEDDL